MFTHCTDIQLFTRTLIVMSRKINACYVFALLHIYALWVLIVAPVPLFERKGRKCNITTKVLMTCRIGALISKCTPGKSCFCEIGCRCTKSCENWHVESAIWYKNSKWCKKKNRCSCCKDPFLHHCSDLCTTKKLCWFESINIKKHAGALLEIEIQCIYI